MNCCTFGGFLGRLFLRLFAGLVVGGAKWGNNSVLGTIGGDGGSQLVGEEGREGERVRGRWRESVSGGGRERGRESEGEMAGVS